MKKQLEQGALVVIVDIVGAQIVRPVRTSSPIDASTIQAFPGTPVPSSSWTLLHPETKLSTQDIATIYVAARKAERIAARGPGQEMTP